MRSVVRFLAIALVVGSTLGGIVTIPSGAAFAQSARSLQVMIVDNDGPLPSEGSTRGRGSGGSHRITWPSLRATK
jgi:hypothetical protein